MGYTVGKVAEYAGVTVRTLHHYDEIGLLSPSDRSRTGYRRYDDADLERLQQIMYYRELGFSLEEIATILDDPQADAGTHLRRQHELLSERIAKLRKMVYAIEFAMEADKVGIKLTPEERFEVFGDFDPDKHADEAKERWGDSETYRESMRRAGRYTKEDWLRITQEMQEWSARIVEIMDAGEPAEGPAAMELAEEHRQHISRWYYECVYEIHTNLADMYVADERFEAFYESIKVGLARYLHDAIHANAIMRT